MALPSDTQKKVDRSIRLLQSAQAGYDGVFELAYSGGKDSDVILQLAKEAGIRYRAIYKNTTIDYPGTLRHVKEMGAEIVMPKMKFFDIVAQMGLPNRMKRFCCGILKEYRYDTSLKKMITGVRRSEGNDRAKRYTEPTQCRGTKKDPYEAIYPILDWTDDDILAFILDRNLKLAPVYYDSGGGINVKQRLGCMGCPLLSFKRRKAALKSNPKLAKCYLRAAKRYWDSHPDSKVREHHADVYEWFARDIFYPTNALWQKHRQSLFKTTDYKQALESFFGIDMTV